LAAKVDSLKLKDYLLVPRCPHCAIAQPSLKRLWRTSELLIKKADGYGRNWATYLCASCLGVTLARTSLGGHGANDVDVMYPTPRSVAEELPEAAKHYLMQANESLHAPDGAAMLAGASVDAMLKSKGLEKGTVYERIEEAVSQGILTRDMAEWAHEVRLGSNRLRHADKDHPRTTHEEAVRSVDFVTVLGDVLFVLPARIAKGRDAAVPGS
jgi:hypothetical protein